MKCSLALTVSKASSDLLLLNLNYFCPDFFRADYITLKEKTLSSTHHWKKKKGMSDLGIRRGNTHFLYCRQVWATSSKKLPTSGLAWIQVSDFTVISLYIGSTCGVFTLNFLYFCNCWVRLYSYLISGFQVSSVRVTEQMGKSLTSLNYLSPTETRFWFRKVGLSPILSLRESMTGQWVTALAEADEEVGKKSFFFFFFLLSPFRGYSSRKLMFPNEKLGQLLVDQKASWTNKRTTLSDELYKWFANALLSLCLFSISAWVCTLSGFQSIMAKIPDVHLR